MSPRASRRIFLPDLTGDLPHGTTKVAPSHAGLVLDKYLNTQAVGSEVNPSRDPLLNEVVGVSIPHAYILYFQRWRQSLADLKQEAEKRNEALLLATATSVARLAVGLGAESVLETSITLHRTYGVPIIPGSALKGVAAAYAHKRLEKEWQLGGKDHNILFGNTESRGYVTFFDALYKPPDDPTDADSSKRTEPVVKDVLTVHHPEYYRGVQGAAPADWDNPIPITFVDTVGTFLMALAGPAKWVKAAYDILALALAEEGVGAKTSSGYGRMTLTMGTSSMGTSKMGNAPALSAQEETSAQLPYALRRQQLLKEAPVAGRMRGTITEVRTNYAFINPAGGGGKVFVHQSQIDAPLREGQIVEYMLGPGTKPGQTQANQVKVLLQPNP